MKRFLLLIMLAPLAVMAQKPAPFKGAKKIIADYEISGDSLLISMAKQLTAADYTVEKKDNELLIVTTEPKNLKYVDYKLRLLVKGNKVELMSKWKDNVTMSVGGAKMEQTWYDWEYARSKGNIQHAIWGDIVKFINSTSPKKVEYE
jgi:hypothetical protein